MGRIYLFIHFVSFSEFVCTKLAIDFEDEPVLQESIAAAVHFGVDFDERNDTMVAKKFIVAVFQKLLLQRDKLDTDLLIGHIKPDIVKMWQEVLSCLEGSNRRLLNIQSGSLVLTMFCPSYDSTNQLQDEEWVKEITYKMQRLFVLLGMSKLNTLS